MNNTARTVAAALATLGLSTTAHAATYVVPPSQAPRSTPSSRASSKRLAAA